MSYYQKVLKKYTILFAEDDAVICKKIAEILTIFFHEVFVAKNGKEAFEYYEDEKPDMILSDIKMPVMDGISLAQKIRQDNFTIPIILLSSFSDQDILIKAANSGIDGYILKPIVLDSMLETFIKVIHKIIPKKELISFENGLFYNTMSEELYKNGVVIPLGAKERKLVNLFVAHKEAVVYKEQIISTIWGLEEVTDSGLKGLLNRLRTKIGYEVIVSIKGSGWKLNVVS